MSEKAEKKADKRPEAAGKTEGAAVGAAKKGGMFSKLPVLIGGVMVVEAVVLFGGFKMLGGGAKKVQGADLSVPDAKSDAKGDSNADGKTGTKAGANSDKGGGDASHGDSANAANSAAGAGDAGVSDSDTAELKVVDIKATNRQTGRTILYDVEFCIAIKSKFKSKVENLIKDREALIEDRIRTIIAESDPEKLGGGSEPGLETLRRQVKYQLDQILGDGMIDEVLVPRCIPYRADF